MDPLALMNNDVATLRMSCEKIFQLWNDSVSEQMKNHCIGHLQSIWNNYLSLMNSNLNQYMFAEKTISESMKKITELMK